MEKLSDLLTIETNKNNALDNKKLLTTIKHLIKAGAKKEASNETKAENLPFEAVSVVGNKFVTVKFDLESKEAIVADTKIDSRDTGHKNYMAAYAANNKLTSLVKDQKEKK